MHHTRIATCSLLALGAAALLAPTSTPQSSPPSCLGGLAPTSLPVVDQDFRAMAHAGRALAVQLGLASAHAHATGVGVRVAVLDGGFDLDHPDIRERLGAGFDALDGDDDPQDPGNGRDDDRDGVTDRAVGHGTFVAGLILRAAPDATILPVRVRDDEGWGPLAALDRGLRFAQEQRADVVNLSVTLGGEDPSGVLERIDVMQADGVVVVVAAGNDGSGRLPALAAHPSVIAVAAVDAQDRLARFSNVALQGAPNLLCAPGVDLAGPFAHGGYARWSGTSFAAALTCGAAALLKGAAPPPAPEAVLERLRATATPVSAGAQSLRRIDIGKAVTR